MKRKQTKLDDLGEIQKNSHLFQEKFSFNFWSQHKYVIIHIIDCNCDLQQWNFQWCKLLRPCERCKCNYKSESIEWIFKNWFNIHNVWWRWFHRNPCVCSMTDQRWLITYTLTPWVTGGNCRLLGEILVIQNFSIKVPCIACRIVFASVRVLGSKATSRKQVTVLQLLHQSFVHANNPAGYAGYHQGAICIWSF